MRQQLLALLPLLALMGAPATRAETPAPTGGMEMTEAERAAFQAEEKAYLLANPQILTEMIALLDAQQKAVTSRTDQQLVADNAGALFDDGYSWVTGNPDGAITIVEFLDYQCGYCRKAFPELTDLVEEDGDIRLIVKDFPILGPGSDLAARATIATMIAQGPEAYGRLHDALMAARGPITDESLDRAFTEADLDSEAIRAAMKDPEVDRRVERNRALGQAMAINGTPTFVFQKDMVRGYVSLANMRELVEQQRATN